MNKNLFKCLLTPLLLLVLFNVCKAQSPIFPDVKDSLIYKIDYYIYSEGQLGNFRDDLIGASLSSNKLKDFMQINNRKIINVIMLRVLTNKASSQIQKIAFYSVRREDTKIIYEFSLDNPSNATDIKLLETRLKL